MNNTIDSIKLFAGKGLLYIGAKTLRFSRKLISSSPFDLTGDRDIEWSWALAELPKGNYQIFDLGPGSSELVVLTAVRNGSTITCFDVRQNQLHIYHDNIKYLTGDILDYNFDGQIFDHIINLSTIEHVGLGHYNDRKNPDGDLKAMQKLHGLLKSDGRMILTIPIGLDKTHSDLHRVYGQKRLELLLRGFEIIKSEFWAKNEDCRWHCISKDKALQVQSYSYYYALGLFVLAKKD